MTDHRTKAATLRLELADLIVDFVRTNPGLTNAEIAKALGLESDYLGGQRNYLTFSLLGDGLASGAIIRKQEGRNVRYVAD